MQAPIPVPKPETYPRNPWFLAWLRRQACAACGLPGLWNDPIEAAHLDSRRYGDEGNAIPLHGLHCHREGPMSLHRIGRRAFQLHYQLDLRLRAEWYLERYRAEQKPLA